MKDLTENMWNEFLIRHEAKEAEMMEDGISVEEYMMCAEELISAKNVIVNTGLKSLSFKSQNVAKAYAEGRPLTETMYKSKTDAMVIDAAVVEGEFYKEQSWFNQVLASDISEADRFTVNDTHNQVLLRKEICVKHIDGALNDAKFAHDEYIAYTKSNEGMDRK